MSDVTKQEVIEKRESAIKAINESESMPQELKDALINNIKATAEMMLKGVDLLAEVKRLN